MQGVRIIIAFIFALQPCMVGNEIGLIRSFSILMCKTRLSVKTGQNVTKCTGYSTVVTIRVFDDDAISFSS